MNLVESFSSIDNNKIAAVVVLYKPSSEIIKNIDTYINEVARLYIIDNSEIKSQYLNDFLSHSKVEYLPNYKNLGIAAALNIAIDKAINSGFLFLLTMDQDSYFEKGSLEKLIIYIAQSDSIGIYSPFHRNKYFTNPPNNRDTEEVTDVMTSGNLLNLDVVKKIGKFKEDYFIDYVDIEYCLRLRKSGYKILRVNNSFLFHNEADLTQKKFLGYEVYPPNHSPNRWYYKIRNYFYLKREYQNSFKKSLNMKTGTLDTILLKFFYLKIKSYRSL